MHFLSSYAGVCVVTTFQIRDNTRPYFLGSVIFGNRTRFDSAITVVLYLAIYKNFFKIYIMHIYE